MNKSIVAIAVAGLVGGVGVSSVASAMEFSVYGSLRAGLQQLNTDDADIGVNTAAPATAAIPLDPTPGRLAGAAGTDKGRDALDLGFTDHQYNRFGIRGSEDLGNGLSAGFHIERGTNGDEDNDNPDRLDRRHESVWIQGAFGKLTFGQQGNPYRAAASWDGSWFLGGNNRFDDEGTRSNGIRYDSNLSGPFSFSVMATADSADSSDAGGVVHVDSTDGAGGGAATVTVTTPAVKDEDGVDSFIATAHFAVGDVATVNVGFISSNVDSNAPGTSYDNAVISANGSFGAFGWTVAYEESDDNVKKGTRGGPIAAGNGATLATIAAADNYIDQVYLTAQDAETVGVFLSLAMSENDLLYLEYEDSSVDGANTDLEGLDKDALLLGYSHRFGPATTFIVEYLTVDTESDYSADSDTFIAALKVDF